MKKLQRLTIFVLLITTFLTFNIMSFASPVKTTTMYGYSYNLYTLEVEGTLRDVSTVHDQNSIILGFTYDNSTYNITYTQNANLQFESNFMHNGKNFYSLISTNGNEYVGMVRDISETANPSTLQFGFIISDSEQQAKLYSDCLEDAAQTETLKEKVEHNKEILSDDRPTVNMATRTVKKVGCYSYGNYTFGEVWADLTMTGSYKSAKITQYNIVIGVRGDGCYLRQYNNNGYNQYLWSTPVNPPRGLQYVNSTYHIPWEYSGALDVTITGLYDIYKVPLPVPVIFADGYDF